MKKFLLILLLAVATFATKGAPIVILDADTGMPLAGVSVFSNKGVILGISDSNGVFTNLKQTDWPVSIRCIGYANITSSVPSDTIRMTAETYPLPDMTVLSDSRPVIRVVMYVREYSTGTTQQDTLQFYGEYMTVSYYPLKNKVKGYKKGDASIDIRNMKTFLRHSDASGLDTIIPLTDPYGDYFLLSHLRSAHPAVNYIDEPEKIKNGASSDTVMGKYYPYAIYQKTPNLFKAGYDSLSDSENHTKTPNLLKMFGLTADFHTITSNYAYTPNDTGKYGINDFLYASRHAQYLARGKWLKKFLSVNQPIEIDAYVECFPIDVTYLTIEEYKEMRKDKGAIKFDKGGIASDDFPAAASLLHRLNTDN